MIQKVTQTYKANIPRQPISCQTAPAYCNNTLTFLCNSHKIVTTHNSRLQCTYMYILLKTNNYISSLFYERMTGSAHTHMVLITIHEMSRIFILRPLLFSFKIFFFFIFFIDWLSCLVNRVTLVIRTGSRVKANEKNFNQFTILCLTHLGMLFKRM